MHHQYTKPMSNPISDADLCSLAEEVLARAKAMGASAAEVATNVDAGYNVSVRLGEVETVEYHRNKGIGLTVYFGQRKGSASTSDTSSDSLKATLEAACNIAQYTQEDPCAALADVEMMAFEYPIIDMYFPWDITVEQAINITKDCETQAMAYDKRITNSEGSSFSTDRSYFVYANSHGFIGAHAASRHSISCALIAQEKQSMERDYSYSIARDKANLLSVTQVATDAAQRTIARLGAKRIGTQKTPVIFEARIASGLIGSFLSAIRGGNLYRRSSFLLDHLHKQVFPANINIYEDPFVPKGLASSPFDGEGVRVNKRQLVTQGILQGYLLSSYSARKLGMQTTGNAGGAHNVFVSTVANNLDQLLQEMGTGLLVTELMGQGVNIVTGDYSRGATGFWVENGEIQYPVAEITIASNLKDMYRNIAAIGSDFNLNSSIRTGSILINEMTIAGH